MRLFFVFLFFLPSLKPQEKSICKGFVCAENRGCMFYIFCNLQAELLCAGLKGKKKKSMLIIYKSVDFFSFFFSLNFSVIYKFVL